MHVLQAATAVQAETPIPSKARPAASTVAKEDSSKVKASASKSGVPKRAEAKSAGRPAPRPKQAAENSRGENVLSGRHVPAYMKATASVKAKDAHDQQAKIAASRTALAGKKWNRS